MTVSARRDGLLSLLAAAALLTGGTSVATAAAEGDIVLQIGGTAGMPFTAACELKTAAGTETFALDQKVPFTATYVGTGLRCRIAAKSAIEAQLVKGGSSSNSSSSGGVVNVKVGL